MNAEVAGNPVKDLVDVQRPRTSPRTLEIPTNGPAGADGRASSTSSTSERLLVDAAGEPRDRKASRGSTPCHQPGLVTRTPLPAIRA